MATISIRNVTKRYADGTPAVNDASIEVADGEFLVLVGPSGCGKSTLLRMVAGLEQISDGEVYVNGKLVNHLPPKDRDIAMIFQNYALFPHMTVARNLAFGLRIRGTPPTEAQARIAKAAETLGLTPFMDRRPSQLSGGQRQRVAIGRALVRNPVAFLMDEPLANLDTKLRVHMRTEFARLRDQLHTTTLYVTHDQIEAMTLGHRVCVLRDGVIQQVDTPDRLFARPANLFVAGFIGSPEMNLALGSVEEGGVRVGSHRLALADGVDLGAYRGRKVIIGIRPTDFGLAGTGAPQTLAVKVELVERLGSEMMVVFPVDAPPVSADAPSGNASEAGHSGTAAFTARLPGGIGVAPGQSLTLAVAPEAMHFFDVASGKAIGRADQG
jgi:multiple sugar transport system ATP-binding protein